MAVLELLLLLALLGRGTGGAAGEDYPPVLLGEDGGCGVPRGDDVVDGGHVNLSVAHGLFGTEVLVPGVLYQVLLARLIDGDDSIEFSLSSSVRGFPAGVFSGSEVAYNCAGNEFRSELGDELKVNWSLARDGALKGNVSFDLDYRIAGSQNTYHLAISRPISEECQLLLKPSSATLTHLDLPGGDCLVRFPDDRPDRGLLVDLTRLNVPCPAGHLRFSGDDHAHRRRLCGKLEELGPSDRHVHIPDTKSSPFLQIHGSPVFSLEYRTVDGCHNVTFTARNASFELSPEGDLSCSFTIHLPYGQRVQLVLELTGGEADPPTAAPTCDGLLLELEDGGAWSHCARPGRANRRVEAVSRGNRAVLRVTARGRSPRLRAEYRAEEVEEVTGGCGFGWVAARQFCVTAAEAERKTWAEAEAECRRKGGHLASVRSGRTQEVIDRMLVNSPGYAENNAYWIGASDESHEGDFRWSDGLPFSYTNWFPGWQQHNHYNRQPNDDGLSNQDCVEIRKTFSLPSSALGTVPSFTWNDRDCSTPNYFVCERLQTDERLEDGWPPDCNRSIVLTRQQPRAAVSSPGFPRQYPDNTVCDVRISAPPGYRVVLDFEELVLESEPSYDYLEIIEDAQNGTDGPNPGHRRLCGDWSLKLKLLRHISHGSRLRLKFSSDYSHHFGGFKARVSIENTLQCEDDRLHQFNGSCYLFVSYPEVTWHTAQKICEGLGANLASVLSSDEEKFVTANIRATPEYRTSAVYWLGGTSEDGSDVRWADGNGLKYLGWLPGEEPRKFEGERCLGMQWMMSPTPMLPSGLYWKFHKCSSVGGYVCKRPTTFPSDRNLNRTLNGTSGNLTSPDYPSNYRNDLDYFVRIASPRNTRISVVFLKIDIENQLECLYDYVQLGSGGGLDDGPRVCGTHETDLDRFNFVSESNELVVRFHADFSITRSGFALQWKAVETPGCPKQTLTASEGVLTSPNYPDFLLPRLDCAITVLAPVGKRVWLEIQDYDFGGASGEAFLRLVLGDGSEPFQPFQLPDLLSEGTYVSHGEYLKLHLKTRDNPKGRGFKAFYRTLDEVKEERVILLSNLTTGMLLHLNFPDKPPVNIDFQQHLSAPLGYTISLELYDVSLTDNSCSGNQSALEVYDKYADVNGTRWHLCSSAEENEIVTPQVPTAITSFLNTIHVRQTNVNGGFFLNGTLKLQQDPTYKDKLLRHKNHFVELCHLYPCLNGGKCITNGTRRACKCQSHFTGPFCAFTLCDLEPCVFGRCELLEAAFRCHCKTGYIGATCARKRRPCEPNPCENKGTCTEKGNTFKCGCRAWWEGPRCEKKMQKIPYTPLSERMFHEPFWLGLMTVTVVMAVIGLVWCAKRHFPEKIEKLLAEDNDRNRSTMSSLRSASVREQLAASGAAAITVTPSPGPGSSKSLFGRLGIRKPSILSLTSPHASGYAPATARTFSLDDLLKPPLRRTPSPKKKRNNSTPTKKNVAEKKQILQQLISPAASRQNGRKVLGELIQMDDRGNDAERREDETAVAETKLSEKDGIQTALADPKMEKKVTFARLLNKVSAEMSSGSEIEMGIMQTSKMGYAFARPSSTPPSPIVDGRSPNSTCSNQGSDSFTSSDLAIPSALSCSISDFLSNRRQNRSPGRQKPASADSILAMFRNFSSSSVGANLSSLKVSPSTTPTASTPQDDAVADDDSSTSSIHTPISFSSGAPESPVLQQRSTIEVPVLDPLSAHKSQGGNLLHPPTILLEIPSTISKCLSPIREMPTPLPSPAITPIMRRSHALSHASADSEQSDDRISIELPGPEEEEDPSRDIPIDPQAEDGLILEEAAAMQKSSAKTKSRPPPLGRSDCPTEQPAAPPPLVIPTLTVQTPSPTHTRTPSLIFPGSPPPQRKFSQPDCGLLPKQQRKLLKEFDKPTSLDLPCAPPTITVTCNMSEAESDAEAGSPAVKTVVHLPVASSGMAYLSPFSMGGRAEHNTSESNLSSSGYSSMASPGPSRCGSSNPLCPSEMEDPGSGHPFHLGRRHSPQLKNHAPTTDGSSDNTKNEERRGRSDSETLSDDPLVESNDEGIGTDHLEEKIEEGELKSAKELEVFIVSDDSGKTFTEELEESRLMPPSNCKNSLQLPSIVVCDSNEKHLSPMSSRSESPLSDRTSGMGRFSPQFYGQHKDLLPFTDSDGLYDFPSSDKVNVTCTHHHRKSGRKRDKKQLRNCRTPSPTKSVTINSLYHNLDVPVREPFHKMASPRKPSPKRRARPQVVTSSSSSESIVSVTVNPECGKWSEWGRSRKSPDASDEENADDVSSAMLPKSEELLKHPKVNRLRAISHQIRFLRRLERSLKRRERAKSPSESPDSGGESPRATSPLLQSSRLEVRKSKSIGRLQCNGQGGRNRRGMLRRGDQLNDDYDFKRIVVAGNGYSD